MGLSATHGRSPGIQPAVSLVWGVGFALLLWSGVAACKNRKKAAETSAAHLTTEAKDALEQGRTQTAVQALRKAVEKHKDSAKTWNRLGLALEYRSYETGDDAFVQEAASAYAKAVELDPHCWVWLINQANLLWATGQRPEAATLYGKALKLKPDHPDRIAIRRRIDSVANGSPQEKTPQPEPVGSPRQTSRSHATTGGKP